jgi:hypothetical protein
VKENQRRNIDAVEILDPQCGDFRTPDADIRHIERPADAYDRPQKFATGGAIRFD